MAFRFVFIGEENTEKEKELSLESWEDYVESCYPRVKETLKDPKLLPIFPLTAFLD